MGRFDHKCLPGKKTMKKRSCPEKKQNNEALSVGQHIKLPCSKNETIIPP